MTRIEQLWNASPLVIRRLINRFTFGVNKRIKFYYKLASFTKSGGKISEVLKLFIVSAKRNKLSHLFILEKTLKSVEDGEPFYEAISPFIPSADSMVLVSGKDSKSLSDVFNRLADTLKTMNEMLSKAYRSAILQTVYLIFMLGILSFLTSTISELMNDMIEYGKTPGAKEVVFSSSTHNYVIMGNFLREYYYYVAAVIVLLIALLIISLPLWNGKTRDYVHRWIFPYTVYRSFEVTRFFLALGSLLGSGVLISKALKVLQENSNKYVAYYVLLMNKEYKRTSQAQLAFQSSFYNADTNDELFFYMKNNSNLTQAIDLIISELLVKVDIDIKKANGLFETMIFVFFVGMIFWSGSSIYELMDVLKDSAG